MNIDWKKHWVPLALVLIVIGGAYFRLADFSELARFNTDQVRDARVIDTMTGPDEFPLLGPKAGGTGFNLGPAFYYLQYFSGIIFGHDPAGRAFFIPLLSITSISLFFLWFRKLFSPGIALGLTVLYASSFYAVKYSRFAWNPNVIPFFLFAFLLILLRILQTNGQLPLFWYVLCGSVMGIGMQLHTTLFILMPIVFSGVIALIFFRTRLFPIRGFLVAISLIILFHAPFIFHELTQEGENVRSFLLGAETKTEKSTSLLQNFLLDGQAFAQSSTYILTGMEPEKNWLRPGKLFASKDIREICLFVFGTIFFVLGASLTIRQLRREVDQERRDILILSSSFTGMLFLFFLPIAEELNVRFFIVVLFLPFLFLGLIVEYGRKCLQRFFPLHPFLFVCLLLVFATANLLTYRNAYDFSRTGVKAGLYGGISLNEAQGLAHFIQIQSAQGEEKSSTIPFFPFEFTRSIEYFLQGSKQNLQTPQEEGGPDVRHFLVVERHKTETAKEKYNCCYEVAATETIGRFTIFALDPLPSVAEDGSCRIGFITDVHGTYSKSSSNIVRRESAVPLSNFRKHMHTSGFNPDVLIEGGDFIDGSEEDPAKAITVYKRLQDIIPGQSIYPHPTHHG